MAAHDCERVPGKKPTSGGSSDTEANDPMVIPNALPSPSRPVTTTTDVGTWPSTARNWAESKF